MRGSTGGRAARASISLLLYKKKMLRKEKEEGERLLRLEFLFSSLRKRRRKHRSEGYFSLFGAAMLVSVDSHQPGGAGARS